MCSFPELKVISRIRPETKYGFPSDEITICEHAGQLVAFLPRHGSKHTLAPHKVPYKANLMALKEIGVEYVIGTCIVGSLKKRLLPAVWLFLTSSSILLGVVTITPKQMGVHSSICRWASRTATIFARRL